MDPSALMCIKYDSLKETHPSIDTPVDIWLSMPQIKLTAYFEKISITSNLPAINSDTKKYVILQKIKTFYNSESFIEARDETNPFEKIGRSIFMNRAAIKLANIDAVHHITNHVFTFDQQTSQDNFTFCDIAAGPGGFTQYLQFRFPNTIGIGMTLKSNTLDWNKTLLDTTRFDIFYGNDGTGNLYTNWKSFINYVKSKYPEGVDLITGDGGFDVEDSPDTSLFEKQEFISSRLLLSQIAVGISCTKINGNFVVKVFDTVTSISAHSIFLLTQCFDKIGFFKPCSSRPANSERYVICMGKRKNIESYITLIEQALHSYKDDEYLSTLFSKEKSSKGDDLPVDFLSWLTKFNDISIGTQLQAGQNILLYMKGKNPVIQSYNIPKFLTIWNLPETLIRKKK